MPVDYQLGKIYKLVPTNYEGDYIPYYGSSAQNYLSVRLAGHIRDYNDYLKGKRHKTTSFKLFEKHGIDNISIILVENYPCQSKAELEARERYYIENNICINKNIPTRTDKEYYEDNKEIIKEYKKEWRNNNKENIKKYSKNYYEINKDTINEYKKDYIEKNKDIIKLKKHNYYENIKEELLEKYKTIIVCECSKKYTYNHKVRHMRSKFHLDFIQKQNKQPNDI